jgi:hypothetical protein
MQHVVEKLRKSAQEKTLGCREGELFSLLLTAACFQCCTDGPRGGNKDCGPKTEAVTS